MIKIAFFSDIHFGKDGRGDFTIPNTDTALGKLSTEREMGAGLISSLKELEPEYLFIAGDLTSVGSPEEYYYCEQKIIDIAKQAGIDTNKIIWCTGNHDNDWSVSKLYDRYKNGRNEDIKRIAIKKYASIATSVVEKNIEILPWASEEGCFPASGVYQDCNMIVFILNSATTCLHDNNVDHGEITKEQLQWLEERTKQFETDRRWKIVLLHHHPFNYPYPQIGVDFSLLSDGSEFLEIIGKGGVQLVLHGHRHHPRCKTHNESNWKNPITFICAGSLSVCEKQRVDGDIPNTYHLIELDEEVGLLRLRSFEYLPGSGWAPVTTRGGTVPIDPVMKLGKIVDNDAISMAIESIADTSDPVISLDWDELDERLQYRPCSEINELINNTLQDRFIVKAKLPTNLTLKRKGDTK